MMVYEEFVTPSDLEILEALGIEPESLDGESSTRVIKVDDGADDSIIVSYDVPGRSVRLQWMKAQKVLVDLFREAAVLMRIQADADTSLILFDFRTQDSSGRLTIQVRPELSIRESDLMR
ncbi:MAG TPA: hypothetical protein VF069_22630 [Streptosporangiaceae bacterium]